MKASYFFRQVADDNSCMDIYIGSISFIIWFVLIQYFGGMDFQEEGKSEPDQENIEEMLDDLGLGDDATNFQASKKDSTVFIIDCSQYMINPLQGEQKTQLELIFEGYYNFLQRKIIANASDKVGLILYNVKNTQNSINQSHIFKVHSLDSQVDARRIKEAYQLYKDFEPRFGGLSNTHVSLNYVLWQYGAEISNIKPSQYYLRVFLFTAQDCPHPVGDQDRQPSIKRAQELAAKNVQIQLFPIRKSRKCFFDVRKFYQEIITFDPEEINSTVLDSSSKILDLQERLRQKEFKKRTLNRLTLKVGKELNQKGEEKHIEIGVKIYSLYTKAKRPVAKKVDAKTNKLLQRVTKKLNAKGQVLFDGVVGTYYPLGGQKIKITKEDMNKIKNLQPPGMTLIGFKPKNLIKPYHNIRTSYFLYPDQQHIQGSSQFFDALISELDRGQLVGIVKLVPRNNQELRFAALFPQSQKYDEEDHFQTPPGFHMVILPFAEDLVSFTGDKTVVQPQQISTELVQVTKLLINNLTIHDFDFRDFENPSLQKFYSHLQAHALNEKDVTFRPDLLEPDVDGFNTFKDVIDLVKETVMLDCEGSGFIGNIGNGYSVKEEECNQMGTRKPRAKAPKIEAKVQQSTTTLSKHTNNELEKHAELISIVQGLILAVNFKEVKVNDLKTYLRIHGLDDKGKKDALIDRVLGYLQHKNAINEI